MKPVMLIMIAVLICAILAGIGGFVWYKNESSTTTTKDTTAEANKVVGEVIKARYVRITTAGNYLNVNEVLVMSNDINVAKGKTITSSSDQSASYPFSNIIDASPLSMGHTLGSGNEWILIDLGEEVKIDKIIIVNRTDCCRGRIIGGYAELLDKNSYVIYKSEKFKGIHNEEVSSNDNVGWAVYTVSIAGRSVVGTNE